MTLSTCGNCHFCLDHPMATADMGAGMCYGHPPAVMLLPMQQTPIGLARPGAGNISATLSSVRPSVLHKDAACSLWQAKH